MKKFLALLLALGLMAARGMEISGCSLHHLVISPVFRKSLGILSRI